MPRFGIGAWEMREKECEQAILGALNDVGYRNIDTAKYYANEREVGAAIRGSSVPREQIYATTKLFTNDMGGGSRTRSAVEDSLSQSGLNYWDLILLHAPDGGHDFRLKTWATLTELVKEGKIRSLGVSNFGEHHIDQLMTTKPEVVPVVNQIECHPFFAQKKLRAHCEKYNIAIQAYCPLARSKYYGDKILSAVAKETGRTEAQVMLRWELQSGMIPLPKSSNPGRQKENAEALAFELTEEQMKQLDGCDKGDQGWVEEQVLSQSCA